MSGPADATKQAVITYPAEIPPMLKVVRSGVCPGAAVSGCGQALRARTAVLWQGSSTGGHGPSRVLL